MNLKKPEFWLKKNLISLVLLPLTIITYLINSFKKFSNKKIFKIKSICIGNIYVGGTGKTTLTILVNQILKKKFKTVFIKKKYNNQKDEINLLKKNGSVISKKNRNTPKGFNWYLVTFSFGIIQTLFYLGILILLKIPL